MNQFIVIDSATPWVRITLNRPDQRNAMNLGMVKELLAFFADPPAQMRALIITGARAHFCAGGDVKDMMSAMIGDGEDPVAELNRQFGHLLCAVEACPVPVIALVHGAVMGGGMGLVCVADIALAVDDAKFRLPEVSLGISPAQIAPFLVRRLGLSMTRRLALTGRSLSPSQALAAGLVHEVYPSKSAAEEGLSAELAQIGLCEPAAVAATKRLLVQMDSRPLVDSLDLAATEFSVLARSKTAQQGMAAFVQRKKAPWAVEIP